MVARSSSLKQQGKAGGKGTELSGWAWNELGMRGQMRGGSGGSGGRGTDEAQPCARASLAAPWLENNPPAVSPAARAEMGARDREALSKQAADEQLWLRAKRGLGEKPGLRGWGREERAKDARADCRAKLIVHQIGIWATSIHRLLPAIRAPWTNCSGLRGQQSQRGKALPGQRALLKQSPPIAVLPAQRQAQPSRAELWGCQHTNDTEQDSLQAWDLL